MAVDTTKVDAAAYNEGVGRTVLRGIRMTECCFDVKPEAFEVDPSNWANSIRGELAEVFSDAETGKLYGAFVFEVVSRHRRKRLLVASARYLVSYAVQGAFEQDVGALFVERVGRVAAYPYFRAVVASLASQSGLVMPPLPIISLAPRGILSALGLEPIAPAGGR